ncbi:Phosphoglucosamine mutase [Escherichia coli]|nr:Phosphoglucosamine mutase [Escherichia coli]
MVRKYFGTDGIRGKANEGAMTAETALRVGMAAGRVFRRGDPPPSCRDRQGYAPVGLYA